MAVMPTPYSLVARPRQYVRTTTLLPVDILLVLSPIPLLWAQVQPEGRIIFAEKGIFQAHTRCQIGKEGGPTPKKTKKPKPGFFTKNMQKGLLCRPLPYMKCIKNPKNWVFGVGPPLNYTTKSCFTNVSQIKDPQELGTFIKHQQISIQVIALAGTVFIKSIFIYSLNFEALILNTNKVIQPSSSQIIS